MMASSRPHRKCGPPARFEVMDHVKAAPRGDSPSPTVKCQGPPARFEMKMDHAEPAPRVRRLSDEAISGILTDVSDASDDPDDPDFEVDSDNNQRAPRSTPKRPRASDSDSSSSAPLPAAKMLAAEVPKPVAKPLPAPTPVMTLEELNIMPHTPTAQGERYICCVKGCSSGNLSNIDGLWLYPLPEDDESLEAWNREVPTIDLEANHPRSPRICFRHFDTSSFVRRQQRLLGLKKGATPSAAASAAALATANNVPKRGGNRGRSMLVTNNVATPQAIATTVHTAAAQNSTETQALLASQPVSKTGQVASAVVTPSTGAQLVSATKTYPRGPVRSSAAVAVPVAITPANPVPLKPQTELFIDLTAEEAAAEDERSRKVSELDDGAPGTNGPKAANAAFSVAINEPEQILGIDYAAEDGYVLTLEDVEEELPWVVPDMHWNSDLVGDELHLVWNNSPNQESCKKVILSKDMRVRIFVGKTQVVLGVKQVTNMASLKALFMEISKL